MIKKERNRPDAKKKEKSKKFNPEIRKCKRVNQIIGSGGVVYGACSSCGTGTA